VIILPDANADKSYIYSATRAGSKKNIEPVKQVAELTEFSIPGGQAMQIKWK
jgi:hypothetical protein